MDGDAKAVADGPATDAIGGQRPSVEVAKTASGKFTWRVRAYATDDSAEALIAARDLVVRLNGELIERYPG
jgi:hypothetical protein